MILVLDKLHKKFNIIIILLSNICSKNQIINSMRS